MTADAPTGEGDGDDADPEAVAAACEFVDCAVGDRVDGVATVTLSRPDARNALNAQLRGELKGGLGAVEAADGGVRPVVLTGADDAKAFAAGAGRPELRAADAFGQ